MLAKMENDSLFEFPCEFPLKIIGYNTERFEVEVLSIVQEVFPSLSKKALSRRLGRHKKYLAITVTVEAVSRQQLDKIYENLSASQQVLWVL